MATLSNYNENDSDGWEAEGGQVNTLNRAPEQE